MTGSGGRSWNWRAQLVWALLGPSLVVLVEVESTFVIMNGLGAVRLARDVRGWPILVAGAILVIVIAAQLSVALRRKLADARVALAEQRRGSEQRAAGGLDVKALDRESMGPGFMPDSELGGPSRLGLRYRLVLLGYRLGHLVREFMSHCVALPWVMETGSFAAAGGC
jgi:hypothetical protein